MTQIRRDNHFVSQFYLKQWSKDKKCINTYRLLVSNEKVPLWELKPIRGVAYRRDLYTTTINGKEVDEFEHWLETEFEVPVQEVIEKINRNKKLVKDDWDKLALFLAAQDVRTPTSYQDSVARWEASLPKLLENTLNETLKEIEELKRNNLPIPEGDTNREFFKNALNIQIVPSEKSETGEGYIKAEIVNGRDLWLDGQQYLLTKTAKALLNHEWSIAKPAKGTTWFTSDHPVVRLNYYGKGEYDLKGGWGNPGGNLFMPITPYHLLFTQIGAETPEYFTFDPKKTREIQEFIAERAQRMIFAYRPMPSVVRFRPRYVDAEEFKREEEMWKNWHDEQTRAISSKSIITR